MVQKYLHHIRLTNWKSEPKYAFYRTINPSLTSKKFLNNGERLGNTMISQLQSHRSFLRNSKSICAKNNYNCANCDILEDEKHFLLHCPLYAVSRAKMLSFMVKLDFSKKDMIVQFLLGGSNYDDKTLVQIEATIQQLCISTDRVSYICRRQDK